MSTLVIKHWGNV